MLLEKYFRDTTLKVGIYKPTDTFKAAFSLAIILNDKPIMLLSLDDNRRSEKIAELLITNDKFKIMIDSIFDVDLAGTKDCLGVKVVSNNQFNEPEYISIVKVNKWFVNEAKIQAVFLGKNNDLALLFCHDNGLAQCFYPEA